MSIPLRTAAARISERRSFRSDFPDGIGHVSERLRGILATVNVTSREFIAAIRSAGLTRLRLVSEVGNS